MDYSRRELADRLAAEYVLGTLRGAARRRFEQLLPAHRELADAVARWQDHLGRLADPVPEVSPSPKTWQSIQRRLFSSHEHAISWWQRLPFWQVASAFATIAAVTLAVLVARGPELPPPVIIVLAPQPAADQAGLRSASFVASLGGDGRQLVVRPLDPEQARVVGRVFELWAVPPGAAPRSLGVLAEGKETALKVPSFFREAAALAVSVEPPGGSPTGAPTGPVVAVGSIRI